MTFAAYNGVCPVCHRDNNLPTINMTTLPSIDRDEEMDRTYIPLPGGWEIQTKGKGSSFRICDTKTGDRWLVADEHLHKMLERMAMEIREAL